MKLIWASVISKPDKKYEINILREKIATYPEALTEILNALEKLNYEIFYYREESIQLLQFKPKEGDDMHVLSTSGTREEICAIQLEPRFQKFMK